MLIRYSLGAINAFFLILFTGIFAGVVFFPGSIWFKVFTSGCLVVLLILIGKIVFTSDRTETETDAVNGLPPFLGSGLVIPKTRLFFEQVSRELDRITERISIDSYASRDDLQAQYLHLRKLKFYLLHEGNRTHPKSSKQVFITKTIHRVDELVIRLEMLGLVIHSEQKEAVFPELYEPEILYQQEYSASYSKAKMKGKRKESMSRFSFATIGRYILGSIIIAATVFGIWKLLSYVWYLLTETLFLERNHRTVFFSISVLVFVFLYFKVVKNVSDFHSFINEIKALPIVSPVICIGTPFFDDKVLESLNLSNQYRGHLIIFSILTGLIFAVSFFLFYYGSHYRLAEGNRKSFEREATQRQIFNVSLGLILAGLSILTFVVMDIFYVSVNASI